MKIRSDFVTNSSSSSYLVAYKPLPTFDEQTLNTYPALKNLVKLYNILINSSYDNIFNEEDWNTSLLENYGYNSIEEMLKEEDYPIDHYNEIISYLKDGFHIARFSVDYSDEGIEYFIRNFAENNDSFIILEDQQ